MCEEHVKGVWTPHSEERYDDFRKSHTHKHIARPHSQILSMHSISTAS